MHLFRRQSFSERADHTPTELVVLSSNGRTRLENEAALEVSVGQTCQITGYVLPLYADATGLTFTIDDTSVCTIDAYGLITVPDSASVAGKTARLTVSNGTLSVTVNIKIMR